MRKKAKKATKAATKKATPARKADTKAKLATQLEVMTQAHAHFSGGKHADRLVVMDALDNTVPGFVSTQSLALDWVTGNGGLPQSRVIDITSDEGGGKSTIADHVMAEVQRLGGHAYLWDTENARDVHYQKKIGIKRSRAGQIVCHTMEDGFEFMIDLISWHNEHDPTRPGVIVWDTPAATPTRNEADPEKTNERFGPAKIIRGQLRTLNQQLQQGRWMLFVVNQTYMGTSPGGQSFKAAYGGGGIPYYSSCRLQISHPSKFWRTTAEKELGLPPVGQTAWVKCIKNRVSPPWRSKQICIHFGEGISNGFEIFHTLLGAGCITSKSGWCRFDPAFDEKLAEMLPGAFQASATQGGHIPFEQTVRQIPGMWERLIDVYSEVMKGMSQ